MNIFRDAPGFTWKLQLVTSWFVCFERFANLAIIYLGYAKPFADLKSQKINKSIRNWEADELGIPAVSHIDASCGDRFDNPSSGWNLFVSATKACKK